MTYKSLLKEWQLSRDEEIEMWNFAKSLGAEVFTSVYELKSIEFTEKMGTIGYKIAAFEMKNKPLFTINHIPTRPPCNPIQPHKEFLSLNLINDNKIPSKNNPVSTLIISQKGISNPI